MVKKINIGSGEYVRKGWDNLDSHATFGANIIHDLNKLPLPIKSNTYDYVFCCHVIEDFIDPIPLIEEFIRITKVGGIIEIRVPNETHFWSSLHHKRGFSTRAFQFYAEGKIAGHYNKKPNVKIKELKYYGLEEDRKNKINLRGRIYWRISVFFANLFGNVIMTETPMKYLFPLVNIKVKFVKIR